MSRPTVYEPLSTVLAPHREAQLPGSGHAPVQRRGADREAIAPGLEAPVVRDGAAEQDRVGAGVPSEWERAERAVAALARDLLEPDADRCEIRQEPLDRGAPTDADDALRQAQVEQAQRR